MKVLLGLLALALFGACSWASAEEPIKVVIPEPPAATPAVDQKIPENHIYESSTKGPYYYQSESELKAHKLARGLANVTLCVAEIPNQMFREAYRTSPVSGGFVGIFKGVAKGSKRLAIGTWEILTFYFPGNNHYQPYIEPEVVFGEYLH